MIGTIESVWRYPVKSMRGEAMGKVFVGYPGLIGDRVHAIHSDARAARFPWFTARNWPDLIRHRARFLGAVDGPVNPEAAHPNLPEASAFAVEVETPEGIVAPLDEMFVASLPTRGGESLSLKYSPRNFVDVTPVSLISHQTVAQLGAEVGATLTPERFRANFNVAWADGGGFFEDSLVGKRLRIGDTVEIALTERDARCKMITLDPDTGAAMPDLLKHVMSAHGGCAGVYGSVVREGFVSPGDEIAVVG
jgi:uncharacterized protein YcbX